MAYAALEIPTSYLIFFATTWNCRDNPYFLFLLYAPQDLSHNLNPYFAPIQAEILNIIFIFPHGDMKNAP